MRLPITVLLHDGPMARAYLTMMDMTDLQPARIIYMINSTYSASANRIGAVLPKPMRFRLAEAVQRGACFHWPRQIYRNKRGLFSEMTQVIGTTYGLDQDFFLNLLGTERINHHAADVDRIFVSGLTDPELQLAIAADGNGTILFTGGGIVPEGLLELEGVQFLHIHPGHLPDIRGADGLLWSTLIRKKLGVSAFIMAPGIDTGDLVVTEEFAPLQFNLEPDQRADDKMLYQAIYSFSFLREELLLQLIKLQRPHKLN